MQIVEATKLKDNLYKPLEDAIIASKFWEYENLEEDADYNTVWGEDVDQTPAAEILGAALTAYFKEIDYPIVFNRSRSPVLSKQYCSRWRDGNVFSGKIDDVSQHGDL